jgi:hypothetical protein
MVFANELQTASAQSMSGDDRYLAPDDPLVRAVAQPEERVLPPLEVLDWWEHPGEDGRTTATGLVAVPRQLVVTTQRILVLRDGSIERSVAMASIGGAHMKEPSEWPLEDSERAVLVHSGGKKPTVSGCWSMATEEAELLMGDIFQLSHGLPLEM